MNTDISIIVASNINIIVQPSGPDPETPAGLEQIKNNCQELANSSNKPVNLLMHNSNKYQFKPVKQR